jgi:nucleoside-diphosphate-sugar epimerase
MFWGKITLDNKMKFTILGSKGFIGSNLVKYLKEEKFDVQALDIDDKKLFSEKLGHVIYAIGVTSDFRTDSFNTIEAHVCILNKLLKNINFDSFLYLSSARIYYGNKNSLEETEIKVNPTNPDNVYNISKIMGESICLSSNKTNVKIARLSNVIGEDFSSNNFVFSLIKDAINKNKIKLETSLESEKDYVSIKDVVRILLEISINGKYKLYNVASGKNIKTQKIVDAINNELDNKIKISDNPTKIIFPNISIKKITDEFKFEPILILDVLPDLINKFKKFLQKDV